MTRRAMVCAVHTKNGAIAIQKSPPDFTIQLKGIARTSVTIPYVIALSQPLSAPLARKRTESLRRSVEMIATRAKLIQAAMVRWVMLLLQRARRVKDSGISRTRAGAQLLWRQRTGIPERPRAIHVIPRHTRPAWG